MTTRFKNAIDALVYAFFNDTLVKGNCKACAVGNICAWSYGYKVDPYAPGIKVAEIDGVAVRHDDWAELVWKWMDSDLAQKKGRILLSRTGYSELEMARIENAFEENTRIGDEEYPMKSKSEIMQDQHNGLMAVVEVLCEIEGIQDPTEYKELFSFA